MNASSLSMGSWELTNIEFVKSTLWISNGVLIAEKGGPYPLLAFQPKGLANNSFRSDRASQSN